MAFGIDAVCSFAGSRELRVTEIMFRILSEEVWILSDAVNGIRRQALLSTPYHEIVSAILANANIVRIKKEPNKHPVLGEDPKSLERYYVEIRLPCDVVDKFHNGAGGYRAQFYESEELGEKANDYCREMLLELVKSIEIKKDQAWMSRPAAISLYCPTAKIWIGQGNWLRLQYKFLRNLHVPRWKCDPNTVDKDRRKRWRQSMLTPDKENRIRLIGGWLRCSDHQRVGKNPKPQRSTHIRCFGFT